MPRLSDALSRASEYLPKWLDLLREMQPLILLGSFSIVIATFAAPLSPSAAGYAIGAAMAFLSGFMAIILSRVLTAVFGKRFDPRTVTISAYLSTGLGIVLLFLVPSELAKAIPTLKTFGSLTGAAFYLLLALFLSDIWFGRDSQQSEASASRRAKALRLSFVAAINIGFVPLAISELFPNLRDLALSISSAGLALLVVTGIIDVFLGERQQKRETPRE